MTPEQMRRAADLLDADAAELRLDGMGDDGRWHIHDERHHYDELTTLARLLREQAEADELRQQYAAHGVPTPGECAALQAGAQGWRPIETAPRESGPVLVAYKNLCGEWRIHEAWWCTPWEGAPDKHCYWRHDGNSCMLDASVHGHGATHWQPLPPPPQP